MALRTADASCPDDSGKIYVGCGNGTVTDNRTGLIWLADANCFGDMDWHKAMEVVAGLSDLPADSAAADHDCGLSDGSSPGEWRLPSVAEFEAMIADAVALGCGSSTTGTPLMTDDAGTACWVEGAGTSFTNVLESDYWSSTTDAFDTDGAWAGQLVGDLDSPECCVDIFAFKTNDLSVWPVRGGQ